MVKLMQTHVQAKCLVYQLSAGGPLTHPGIHATFIAPICPHTLSFRPTFVPDSIGLRVCVSYNSRNTAWASFDSRGRVKLKRKLIGFTGCFKRLFAYL